ncbi:MAG: vWA domain-containing protein [Spirochaetota bacterium]
MYTAEINRGNPALLLFLFDCSYSMSEKYGDSDMTRGKYLAKICNESIDQVILSCEKGDEIRGYFEIGIIGYGEGTKDLLAIDSIINLANNPKKIIKGEFDGVQIDRPIWIEDPTEQANTDMKAGFEKAKSILEDWVEKHPLSFPPVLIHVSDGQWTSDSPVDTAVDIQNNVKTEDGGVIIMNIHISGDSKGAIVFPTQQPGSDKHQNGLYEMSSILPEQFLKRAQELYPDTGNEARAYMFNAQPDDLSKFFDIGTRLVG